MYSKLEAHYIILVIPTRLYLLVKTTGFSLMHPKSPRTPQAFSPTRILLSLVGSRSVISQTEKVPSGQKREQVLRQLTPPARLKSHYEVFRQRRTIFSWIQNLHRTVPTSIYNTYVVWILQFVFISSAPAPLFFF